jgi:hypothetical protein
VTCSEVTHAQNTTVGFITRSALYRKWGLKSHPTGIKALSHFNKHVNRVYDSLCGHAVWAEGLGRLVVEITGSNPASGVDVCPMSLYVLLSQALRRTDHLSKESAMFVSEINV